MKHTVEFPQEVAVQRDFALERAETDDFYWARDHFQRALMLLDHIKPEQAVSTSAIQRGTILGEMGYASVRHALMDRKVGLIDRDTLKSAVQETWPDRVRSRSTTWDEKEGSQLLGVHGVAKSIRGASGIAAMILTGDYEGTQIEMADLHDAPELLHEAGDTAGEAHSIYRLAVAERLMNPGRIISILNVMSRPFHFIGEHTDDLPATTPDLRRSTLTTILPRRTVIAQFRQNP